VGASAIYHAVEIFFFKNFFKKIRLFFKKVIFFKKAEDLDGTSTSS
jgi:hypothetical protein